jgi:hypothetical protein
MKFKAKIVSALMVVALAGVFAYSASADGTQPTSEVHIVSKPVDRQTAKEIVKDIPKPPPSPAGAGGWTLSPGEGIEQTPEGPVHWRIEP